MSFAYVVKRSGHLAVIFGANPPSNKLEFECILDRDDFGEVVGVEILSAETQLGPGVAGVVSNNRDLQWSYDPEMDAAYLRLSRGSSRKQESAHGIASLDSEAGLVSLDIAVQEVS